MVAGPLNRGATWITSLVVGLLGCMLVWLGAGSAQALPGAPTGPTRYADCGALSQDFANGVARSEAAARSAMRAGYLRPAVDAGTYRRNAHLDPNANGVVCEQEAGPHPAQVRWSEPEWCTPRRSLVDLKATYDPANPRPTLVQVAQRRYPPAVTAIGAQSDETLRMWLRQADGRQADFEQLLAAFDVVTHEGGHALDLSLRTSPFTHAYRIWDDSEVIQVAAIQAYPRSEILRIHPSPARDVYASVYLEGPSGQQDVEMLVEEFVQYVNSLASAACVRDVPRDIRLGNRDALLTMMWWIQLYLRIGREEHPAAYAAIRGNQELVRVILNTWDRAEYWLDRTRGSRLGDADAAVARRVYEPLNLAEVEQLRQSSPTSSSGA